LLFGLLRSVRLASEAGRRQYHDQVMDNHLGRVGNPPQVTNLPNGKR
jgi:hypothetical protein